LGFEMKHRFIGAIVGVERLVTRSICCTIPLVAVAISVILGMSSPAAAVTYTGGAGTQADPTWSVTVGTGISLIESVLYTGSTTPAGPANQGYTSGSGHILDWVQNTAGFTGAGLVTNGQVTSMSFTGTDADLFAVHFGCGNSGPCELVWLFSGDTTFTVNTLNGFSNISAFDPTPTPLPAALPLFASGLGVLGLLGWRRKRSAIANAA
jgi:hypothetical protein